MKLGRFCALLFYIIPAFAMLGDSLSYAAEPCNLNDSQLTESAEQGVNHVVSMIESESQLNSILNGAYKNSNGACHYLYTASPGWQSNKNSLSAELKNGATNADSLISKKINAGAWGTGLTVSQALSVFEQHGEYLGWDLDKMSEQAELDSSKSAACKAEIAKAKSAQDKVQSALSSANQSLGIISGRVECSCQTNAHGQTEGSCTSESSTQVEAASSNTGCKQVAEYQAELTENCLICELFASISGAAQNLSRGSFTAVAGDLSKLLGVALLIYIAYLTLITIASPEAQKISKYLASILIQSFKVMIAVLILQNPTFLYQKALGPILDGSVDFGLTLSGTSGSELQGKGAKYAANFDQSNEYLDANTLQNMVGATENFSDSTAMMPAIGRALICRSFDDLDWKHAYFIPRIQMWFEGTILYVFGLIIQLSIGFYLLNCALELGFVCTLMAFFVACWPFKMTNGYTKIGWNMFLNVFFYFIMMSVVITAIVALAAQSVAGGMPVEEFLAKVNNDSVDQLEKDMEIGGLQMLLVVVTAMICLKLSKETTRLAQKFAGGAQLNVGGELGGLAAGVATKMSVGDVLQKGKDGKHHLGGAAGLLAKGGGALGGSIAEHTGLKGAASAAGNWAKGKAQSAIGLIGLGSKARMGAKGRDQNANQNRDTSNNFNQDS